MGFAACTTPHLLQIKPFNVEKLVSRDLIAASAKRNSSSKHFLYIKENYSIVAKATAIHGYRKGKDDVKHFFFLAIQMLNVLQD